LHKNYEPKNVINHQGLKNIRNVFVGQDSARLLAPESLNNPREKCMVCQKAPRGITLWPGAFGEDDERKLTLQTVVDILTKSLHMKAPQIAVMKTNSSI